MKRASLFTYIILIAISLCFFSTAIIAGDGRNEKPGDDEHPWENDSFEPDTTSGNSALLKIITPGGGDSFATSFTLTLSSRFVVWLYSEQIFIQDKQEIKTSRKTISRRGKLSLTK